MVCHTFLQPFRESLLLHQHYLFCLSLTFSGKEKERHNLYSPTLYSLLAEHLIQAGPEYGRSDR